MGLISLPCLLASAGLVVFGFFQPGVASKTFIAIFIVGLQGLCAALLLFNGRQTLASRFAAELSVDELDLINAYKLHFMYPGATRELSSAIAGVGLACLAFAPLLLWKEHYVEAAIIGMNWFVAGPLSHKLSPFNGLKGMAEGGNDVAFRRLQAWDSTWSKIAEIRRSLRESRVT